MNVEQSEGTFILSAPDRTLGERVRTALRAAMSVVRDWLIYPPEVETSVVVSAPRKTWATTPFVVQEPTMILGTMLRRSEPWARASTISERQALLSPRELMVLRNARARYDSAITICESISGVRSFESDVETH